MMLILMEGNTTVINKITVRHLESRNHGIIFSCDLINNRLLLKLINVLNYV